VLAVALFVAAALVALIQILTDDIDEWLAWWLLFAAAGLAAWAARGEAFSLRRK
jgi:hypothetical protein